jgi:hypothetical protein
LNKLFLRRLYKGFFRIPPFMIVYSINPEEVNVLLIKKISSDKLRVKKMLYHNMVVEWEGNEVPVTWKKEIELFY